MSSSVTTSKTISSVLVLSNSILNPKLVPSISLSFEILNVGFVLLTSPPVVPDPESPSPPVLLSPELLVPVQ